MKVTKKKIVVGIGVAAIVLFGVSRLMPKAPQAMMVSTSPVIQKDIYSTLSLKAPLEGTDSIEIVSRLHYEILSIHVAEGDKVTKGQVLATLDTKDLEREIEALKDNIALLKIQNSESSSKAGSSYLLAQENLKHSLEESQRQYEAALETQKTAATAYENAKVLFGSGMTSEAELKGAENAYNSANRAVDAFTVEQGRVVASAAQLKELETAREAVQSASAAKSIEIAEKELQRKQEALEDCIITSSISGTVTRVNSNVGRFADEIDDNKPIFVIENVEQLKLEANVSEYDIDKLEVGQKVQISADILKGEIVEGIVSRISPTGEEKAGTTERVIPIQIDIVADSKTLIAGITATAKIETGKSLHTLVVPIEALLDQGDDSYSVCLLKEDHTIQWIPVTLGVEDILEIEIIAEGIQEGDKVILNPDATMEDGMQVVER